LFERRQCGAIGSVTAADHDNVVVLTGHDFFCFIQLNSADSVLTAYGQLILLVKRQIALADGMSMDVMLFRMLALTPKNTEYHAYARSNGESMDDENWMQANRQFKRPFHYPRLYRRPGTGQCAIEFRFHRGIGRRHQQPDATGKRHGSAFRCGVI
jgi:hypothetical protein